MFGKAREEESGWVDGTEGLFREMGRGGGGGSVIGGWVGCCLPAGLNSLTQIPSLACSLAHSHLLAYCLSSPSHNGLIHVAAALRRWYILLPLHINTARGSLSSQTPVPTQHTAQVDVNGNRA